MASLANQTVQSANTVYFMIKNVPIARAQSISSERSFGTQGVYQIGSIMPQEHVYLRYEGSVTVERFRMKKENLASLGFAALGEEVLQMDIMDIVLYDNLTQEVVIAYRGCSIDSYNESVNVGEISSETARFYFLTSANVRSA
ncbi:virion structural protein [Bacillus phage B4]|uniref:Tail tube protein n=12 Tax=Caudoviricetes TaxID=2731619 RepID=A0A7U3T8T0_9CAUD|nr:virion structural protein [Bacillus phage B4]YP_008430869.1 virion structural protein [Bacillus phage Troll]YP_008770306.1 virion structural protein [Bacillus phage Spock]YP_008771109.1 virion structural protein [Bacillus phage BigBertha]YP_009055844.1 virion structural protein [Bacillus phage Riley]YP_009206438.1 virion structural protein [Bacillus phage AvesoBmore]YP_009289961.1 virion structural protein [Bacillus phage Phrodo]YP_009783849.1 putative structural protein [Bacillus phage B